MFGAKKLTADDLAAALDPKIMSDLSSEMQNPTAAKRLVRETAEYFGSQKDWFTGKKARNEVIKEFERIVAGETIKAEMCRKDLARLSSMHSKGEFDVLLQDADNVLEPSEYGVIDGDDDVTRAAKWICKCSGTLKGDGLAAVRDVIKKGVSSKEPLTIEAVDRMWRELVPVPSHRVRHIAESAIPLLCDKVGHVKMENAITMKTGADDSRDKAFYLMSTIIRAHGYPDGNGRVARVVYAVSQLRGLPDVAQSPAKTTWVQEGHGRYRKVVEGGQPAARFVAPTTECATALTTL
jgi:hypothetical protein